ncbi:MAG: hypothetical protein WBD36_11035 [Bacteroidota bacterium]
MVAMNAVKKSPQLLATLLAVAVLTADAQLVQHVPGKERVNESAKRKTEIAGNNVRTSVFNYLFSGRLGVGQGVAYEWPKNTKREYIALVALWIGGEVVDNDGNVIHIVDLPSYRSNPSNGANWNMLPIPGYFSTARPDGGIIAKSDVPSSWPDRWPDKLTDSLDPGWKGKWNGYFGKNQFSADQEMFYRVGDDNYNKYNYSPDTTDPARRGLGMIVDSRVMEWSQVSVQDVVFFIHEFKNDGTKPIRKVGTTIWLADLVGGDGDSQDDTPDFDLRLAVAFSFDKDGLSSNSAYQGAFVGAVATSFLETPGNAVDRIDNDGDSPENPQTGGGPAITTAMFDGEVSGDGIDNNHNGLIDEDSTFVSFGTQKAVTFANGIDDNANGEPSSPVITQVMIDSAAVDYWKDPVSGKTYHWNRWPPHPETDPAQRTADGKPIIQLINVQQADLGKKYKDNIDNDENLTDPHLQGYNNLPRITQGMIDTAALDPYKRYRVKGTNVILYNVTQSMLGKRYLNRDGLRDPNVDEFIDEMIDESRDDGVDNNYDWIPLTDDVGQDGAANSGDITHGEGDSKPTSGAGTPFPGEPRIDKTDIKEADQIGVTNVQYNRAGSVNFNTTADITYWSDYMTPGKFVDPAVIKASGPGDYDLYVSSGFFPLEPGQIERVSYSVVFGNAISSGDATTSGAKADALRKRVTAQLAYNENYQFAQVPIEPHVTAVAGDRKVTLYWDDLAEQSTDRFLEGLGADGNDFEGYRIYRSTDPAFEDARIITDAYGNPAPFLKPIAQFDLKDGIKGFSNIDYNGVKFYMGDDTGILHTWMDSTVQNGQKYYYAVRAYDKGYAPLDITPSESNLQINIDNQTGLVKEIGASVAIVVPEAPAAGYLPPEVTAIKLISGSTTGTVGYKIINPDSILNRTYRITFEDTVISGGGSAQDTFKTKNFTLADITALPAIDTLIRRSKALSDTIEQPLINGFRLVLLNEKSFGINPQKSRWSSASIYPYQFLQWRSGFVVGQQKPSDYKVVFGSAGTDTSTQYEISTGYSPPSIPVNFKIFNTSENKQIDFAFVELDPDSSGPGVFSAKYDPSRPGSTRSDIVVFLERNTQDSLIITWSFNVLFDSAKVAPKSGDTASIVLSKLFRASDVFEFSTRTQRVDQEAAKAELDKIKVVPNPYVAAATWEERNPFSTGRGPRSIHFNHLPQVCTIRIYTISGELVAVIEHNEQNGSVRNGTAEWNLLTRDNLAASYGVYIYHVDAPGIGDKIGKFAVIK